MTKSASGNSSKEFPGGDKRLLIVAFLAIQALFLMCLLIYYYESISIELLSAVLAWAVISLALAASQVHLRFLEGAVHPPRESSHGQVDIHLFGVPGKSLDLSGLCALMQEGVALLRGGHIIYVNSALAYILAANEEELIGTRIGSYVYPEDAGLINLEGNLVPSGGPSRATLRLTTRLGDVRWVICSVHSVDWQGEDAVLLLFENIGPLKQAQQSMEEHEHQSRILLERTPLGVAMFDAMGQLKLSNTAWHSIWSSIVGSGARRFNILQDPFLPNTAVERAIRQAYNKKDSGLSNFEHTAPWGETRWLNLNFHPMADPMGRLIGVAMIQQDITDQIRSARRENELNDQLTSLRHELAYYGSFLEQMQDRAKHVIINFEQDGSIAGWNNYAERRFKLPKSKVLGVKYKRLEADFSPYIPILHEAISTRQPHVIERFERVDENGLHYEKIMAHTAEMGLKPLIILEIKDITHHIFDKTMRALLGRFAAINGMGKALAEIMDFSGNTPSVQKSGAAKQKLAEISNSVEFLKELPQLEPKMKKIAIGTVLNSLTGQKERPITAECVDPQLEITTDSVILTNALTQLADLLLAMDFGGNEPGLTITQNSDRFYVIISLRAQARDKDGLTDFPAILAAIDASEPDFEKIPQLKSIFEPVLQVAACGGILGAYSNETESGFVCRFRLPGTDEPLIGEQ